MREFKCLSVSSKAKKLEKYGIYTIICGVKSIKKDEMLIKKLKHLLGVSEIICINKQNNYSKGIIKLYVKTKEVINW